LEGEVSPWLTLRCSPPSLAGDTPATPLKYLINIIYSLSTLYDNNRYTKEKHKFGVSKGESPLVVARKGWGFGGRKNYASKKFGFPSPK